MSTSDFNSEPATNADNPIVYTPATSHTAVSDSEENYGPYNNSVPSDGDTVIVRCVSSGQVLTLLDGDVVLSSPGRRGSIHWTCVENEGWISLRNHVTGKFLCHDWSGRLKCTAQQRNTWSYFTITPLSKGGYIMQMLDWWTLCPIVINPERGLRKLGRTGKKLNEGVVWEFVKVFD